MTGDIGDLEPMAAIKDALSRDHYDEIIVSTLPLSLSRWLKPDIVSEAQSFGLPVTTSWVKTAGLRERPIAERFDSRPG